MGLEGLKLMRRGAGSFTENERKIALGALETRYVTCFT